MSYSIFYRAMFIKMNNGDYIPMIESGDNNVWEADNRRRAREWNACRWCFETPEQRKRYALSEQEILGLAQEEVNKQLENVGRTPPFGGEPYTREKVLNEFSYFAAIQIYGHSNTTAAQFLNFFKSGLRNAVAFDELPGAIHLSWWKEGKYQCDFAADEEELQEKWKSCLTQGFTPYLSLSDYIAENAWQEIKNRNRKNSKRNEPDKTLVIAFEYQGCTRYLTKLSSRRIWFNPFPDDAHRYASRKIAENTVTGITRRFPQFSNIHVENIKTKS